MTTRRLPRSLHLAPKVGRARTLARLPFVFSSTQRCARVRVAVVELSEQNFEHLTQAATGATTGDWFVKFYAPWCGHCKRLIPEWNALAGLLKGEVNVAAVDTTREQGLKRRFKVSRLPVLAFFRRGKVYEYTGERDAESIAACYARPAAPPPHHLTSPQRRASSRARSTIASNAPTRSTRPPPRPAHPLSW